MQTLVFVFLLLTLFTPIYNGFLLYLQQSTQLKRQKEALSYPFLPRTVVWQTDKEKSNNKRFNDINGDNDDNNNGK